MKRYGLALSGKTCFKKKHNTVIFIRTYSLIDTFEPVTGNWKMSCVQSVIGLQER